MKIKTSELSGAALDWAVGLCMGWQYRKCRNLTCMGWYDGKQENFQCISWRPSTDWGQGGPLIERFCSRMATNGDRSGPDPDTGNHYEDPHVWSSCAGLGSHGKVGYGQGRTALIAACRAIVAAKLGDEVDVPEGLV